MIIAAALGALPLLGALIAGAGVVPEIVIFVLTPIVAYCRWWLYDRLVCLNGGADVCALGMLLSVESPSERTGLDRFDTDYSINLMLPPTDIGDDEQTAEGKAYRAKLIRNQLTNVKFPINETPDFTGHVVWDATTAATLRAAVGDLDNQANEKIIVELSQQLHLPSKTAVLHAEFEGGGVYDLLLACLAALALATVAAIVCAAGLIGFIACLILSFIATLIVLGGAAVALSDTGSPDDVDANLGELHVNDSTYRGADIIVVKGSWVYDSAHEGWNEIHPINHCQKTGNTWQCTWESSGIGRSQRWSDGTADQSPGHHPRCHHPADGHHPPRHEHRVTHARPNVGRLTPLYGLAKAEDDGHLLREKRMALTRGQRGGKHVRGIRRGECGRSPERPGATDN